MIFKQLIGALTHACGLLVLLCLPLAAQALSWSSARITSAPQQAFELTIELDDVKPQERVNLRAALAPTQTAQTLGIQVAQVLQRATFTLKPLDGQRLALVIKAPGPLPEPTARFYVMLSWDTGVKLLPVNINQQNVSSDNPADEKSGQQPATSNRPQTLRVKRGDTASELINGYRDDTVNLDQMLLALLAQNPNAFVDGNVNRLKSDVNLQVPDLAQARAIDKTEARRQMRLQIDAFNAYKTQLAQRLNQIKQTQANSSARGDVVKPVQATEPPKDQLKLSQADAQAADRLAQSKNEEADRAQVTTAQQDLERLNRLKEQATQASGSTSASGNGPGQTQANGSAPDNTSAIQADSFPSKLMNALEQEPRLYWLGAGLLLLLLWFALYARRRAKVQAAALASGTPNSVADPTLVLPTNLNLDLNESDATTTPHAIDAVGNRHAMDHSSLANESSTDTRAMASASELTDDDNPHRVRLQLATELWKLGQVHTSRAIVEEVLEQADPPIQEEARLWLAERA